MSNSRQRGGQVPVFNERWKELAKDPKRLTQARAEYMRVHPNVRLVGAHRVVKEFHVNFVRSYGNR